MRYVEQQVPRGNLKQVHGTDHSLFRSDEGDVHNRLIHLHAAIDIDGLAGYEGSSARG
mgnify:CR=1 FL=1